MGRAKTILQSEFPYCISGRCINKEWFRLPMEQVWEIFSEELFLTSKYYGLEVRSFVLMSNHFHLIASTPGKNLDQCMHYFMGNTSRRLTEKGNRINQTFSGRYYKSILGSEAYFLNAYKYIYRNPVQANMVGRAEDYRFCTLNGLLGRSKCLIPVVEDKVLFESVENCLEWLNQSPLEEHLNAMTCGLKRQYFKSKLDRATRKPIIEEGFII